MTTITTRAGKGAALTYEEADANFTNLKTDVESLQGNITAANSAIATANTAMKSYVDAVTTAWTANAGAQANQIAGANAAIVTANTAVKSYVDTQITTTQSWVTGANASIVSANTALKGYTDAQISTANTALKAYVDTQDSSITSAWTSNAGAQADQIAGANASIATANTAMKNYVDGQITTTQSWVTGANASIATANTALKGYVDAQFTALTNGAPAILDTLGEIATSLGNNASLSTTLLNSIAGSNAAIVTANTALKSYVDTQITTTQSWVTGANAAIVTANTALKSYVDTQDSAITTAWTSNAATQAGQIAGANAAITTANTALKGYVDAQITTTQSWVTGANAAIITANTALKGYTDDQISTANTALKSYVDAQDASVTSAWTSNAGVQADAITALQSNAGAQANQITAANVNTARIDANLGSFQTYANLTFGTTSYANANVASYLPVYGGNIAANAVTRNGFAWQFNTDGSESFPSATAVTTAAGKMWYDDTTGAWNLGMGGGNITQQIGEEIFVYGKASATITDSPLQLIYKTGTVGASGVVTFAPTVAGITDTNLILGCATEAIALNAFGRVTSYGLVRNITTNGTAYGETWADDQDIYYNPSTGGLTKTVPTAPGLKVYIGTVINAGSGGSGSFFVDIGAAGSLNSLSDVQTATNTAGQVLSYSSSSGHWKNTSLTAGSGIDITTYTNGNIAIAGTYSNTNTAAYLAGGITVGNISSTDGYFWANGTAYSSGTGTAFTGNLVNNSLTASGTGRILANASPQVNVQQISTYTQGVTVTTAPSYTGANLNSANQSVVMATSGNVNFLTSWAAGTRTTIGTMAYLGVTATSANTLMNATDRIRPLVGGMDLNLNGKSWGPMSSTSNALTPILVNGQTLNVYGTGNMGQAAGIGAAITITPVSGSINAQYVTANFPSISYSTAGAGTTSNIQFARLYTGAVTATGALTVNNAIALHTFSGWTSSNVSLVTNAYVILNEDTRSTITTAGNINIANNTASTGFIKFAVFTVAQITAVAGSAGQMAAVSDGTAKNSGQLAYWDSTNVRWSWVDSNLAVS